MFIQDFNFLKKLLKQKNQTSYIKIEALTWDEAPLKNIQGRITAGSVNMDGNSSMRRSCSLTFIPDKKSVNLKDINNIISINKKIKIYQGIKNEIDNSYDEIIWFNLGCYVIESPSISMANGDLTVSISCKDFMCLLNGDIAGTFPAPVTFSQYRQYDEEEEYEEVINKVFDIIQTAVHFYAGIPIEKIYISDVPLKIKQSTRYVGNGAVYYDSFNKKYTQNSDGIPQEVIDGNTNTSYWQKFEYNDDIGYKYIDFVYPGELASSIGESVDSVLNKLVSGIGGNYEYFFDVDGNFIFREKKNYLNTYYLPPAEETNLSRKDFKGSTYSLNNLTILDALNAQASFSNASKSIYDFSNEEDMVVSYANTPQYSNIKNDFHVWGKSSDNGVIHYHLAIKEKPKEEEFGTYQVVYEKSKDEDFEQKKEIIDGQEVLISGDKIRLVGEGDHDEIEAQFEIKKEELQEDLENASLTINRNTLIMNSFCPLSEAENHIEEYIYSNLTEEEQALYFEVLKKYPNLKHINIGNYESKIHLLIAQLNNKIITSKEKKIVAKEEEKLELQKEIDNAWNEYVKSNAVYNPSVIAKNNELAGYNSQLTGYNTQKKTLTDNINKITKDYASIMVKEIRSQIKDKTELLNKKIQSYTDEENRLINNFHKELEDLNNDYDSQIAALSAKIGDYELLKSKETKKNKINDLKNKISNNKTKLKNKRIERDKKIEELNKKYWDSKKGLIIKNQNNQYSDINKIRSQIENLENQKRDYTWDNNTCPKKEYYKNQRNNVLQPKIDNVLKSITKVKNEIAELSKITTKTYNYVAYEIYSRKSSEPRAKLSLIDNEIKKIEIDIANIKKMITLLQKIIKIISENEDAFKIDNLEVDGQIIDFKMKKYFDYYIKKIDSNNGMLKKILDTFIKFQECIEKNSSKVTSKLAELYQEDMQYYNYDNYYKSFIDIPKKEEDKEDFVKNNINSIKPSIYFLDSLCSHVDIYNEWLKSIKSDVEFIINDNLKPFIEITVIDEDYGKAPKEFKVLSRNFYGDEHYEWTYTLTEDSGQSLRAGWYINAQWGLDKALGALSGGQYTKGGVTHRYDFVYKMNEVVIRTGKFGFAEECNVGIGSQGFDLKVEGLTQFKDKEALLKWMESGIPDPSLDPNDYYEEKKNSLLLTSFKDAIDYYIELSNELMECKSLVKRIQHDLDYYNNSMLYDYKPNDWRVELYMRGAAKKLRSVRPSIHEQELLDNLPDIYDFQRKTFKTDMVTNINSLRYFIDYIEPTSIYKDKFSVENIGSREYTYQSDKIDRLYTNIIPNVILFANGDEDSAQYCRDTGIDFSVVPEDFIKQTADAATGVSAQTVARNILYQYTDFNEAISISIIPIYFLEPGYRITLNNKKANIEGDYIIQSISWSFGSNTMSISATKAVDRI